MFFLLFVSSCTSPPEEQEVVIEHKNPEAQTHSTELFINGYELLYDCFNCTPSYNDSVIVYAKKDTVTKELFRYVLGDFYFAGITPFKQDDETFLLAKTSHTYGHSNGYLYHIDTTTFKTTRIDPPQRKTTIPDSLEVWKEFGLQLEDSILWDGASFTSKVNSNKYYLTITYDLQKTSSANYRLIIKNEKLLKDK